MKEVQSTLRKSAKTPKTAPENLDETGKSSKTVKTNSDKNETAHAT
jgi:hypothetical protein